MHVEHAGWPLSAPDVVPGVCAPFPMFSSVPGGPLLFTHVYRFFLVLGLRPARAVYKVIR